MHYKITQYYINILTLTVIKADTMFTDGLATLNKFLQDDFHTTLNCLEGKKSDCDTFICFIEKM